MSVPKLIVIAGANGSGKSTSAPAVIAPSLTFLNADDIAGTLTEIPSQKRELLAARRLFERWDELAEQRADFAVETTLASRTLAPRIARLQASGYQFHLVFFWLPSADLAVARVAERVRQGGHNIPENTIRRRYASGLQNFYALYQPLADSWSIFDNTALGQPRLVAIGQYQEVIHIYEPALWLQMQEYNRQWRSERCG